MKGVAGSIFFKKIREFNSMRVKILFIDPMALLGTKIKIANIIHKKENEIQGIHNCLVAYFAQNLVRESVILFVLLCYLMFSINCLIIYIYTYGDIEIPHPKFVKLEQMPSKTVFYLNK